MSASAAGGWAPESFIEYGIRESVRPALLQERDIKVVEDVWRYKFLNTDQLRELHWPGRSEQATRRRLVRLFEQGYLERLRPRAQIGQGTYQWTYHLGPQGHALLKGLGHLAPRARFEPQRVFDFAYVLHDIQANGWVLAYRRLLGARLIAWRGEAEGTTTPPGHARQSDPSTSRSIGDGWAVKAVDWHWVQPIYPDAVLDIELASDRDRGQLYVEFDRTGRADKNADKLRRYDTFLTWWWRVNEEARAGGQPLAIFVCPSASAVESMLHLADELLSCRLDRWQARPDEQRFTARNRILFVNEVAAYRGNPSAWRVPAFPRGHQARESDEPRQSFLPTEASAAINGRGPAPA